jgi:hypothetical protein
MVDLTKDEARARFSKRLNLALEKILDAPQRGRPAWTARRYGVSIPAAQKWLSGESIPDQAHLSIICTDLKVRYDWLFTGHGPMRITDSTPWPFAFGADRFERLSPGEKVKAEGALLGTIVDLEGNTRAPKKRAG